MRVVIPFDADTPKTRLSDVLSPAERTEFAHAMLRDVVATVVDAGGDPTVLATDPTNVDAPVTVDDRPLTPLVNAAIDDGTPLAVVMADLPIATSAALSRLFTADGDVVIAPGRGGGTNALVVRDPAFRVDYHGVSYADHRDGARAVGASVAEVDSFRLATDVDEATDLVEVLLHGEGEARRWLREQGFRVAVVDGRPTVTRE
ncbi:MAG: 2-phospho-L-lactate guanylyltransferase [Halanaeroarchaeum sp.]